MCLWYDADSSQVRKIGIREGELYDSWYYFFAIWSIVPEGTKDQINQGFTNISSSRGSTIMFGLSKDKIKSKKTKEFFFCSYFNILDTYLIRKD